FSVTVNSVARTVNSVVVSGTMVQLTLASAIKYGEIVKVSYVKPATNPLQTAAGGQAINISAQTTINNIINPTKDATAVKITMTISPYHIHRVINIQLQYSSTFSSQDPAMSPQIIRISDISGKLYIEKLVVTGVTNIRVPINLRSGAYNVMIISGGVQMASQKIMVY
ncbi:MAG TPA: SwmB domain-containing protein, partial [Bacteroidales bacterium]